MVNNWSKFNEDLEINSIKNIFLDIRDCLSEFEDSKKINQYYLKFIFNI